MSGTVGLLPAIRSEKQAADCKQQQAAKESIIRCHFRDVFGALNEQPAVSSGCVRDNMIPGPKEKD